MQRQDFRFLDRLRVRWAEVDMQKIVFNGHYLLYFDTAVAAYWRALALPYHDTMAQLKGDIFVRKATLEYEGSARYDDLLDVGVRCARIGKSSMVFQAAVFRGETRLVHGELVYVFADPTTQTSQPVPEVLRAWLLGFEAGEDVLDLRSGTWAELHAGSRAVRQAVYVDEMGAPLSLLQDSADETALHAVACNRARLPIATGRLVQPQPGVGQVGRMATLPSLRGMGYARRLLAVLVAASQQRGDRELVLQAAPDAVAFYERCGFARTGATFEEAGTLHIEMRRVF